MVTAMLDFLFSPDGIAGALKNLGKVTDKISDRVEYIKDDMVSRASDSEYLKPDLADQQMTAANKEVMELVADKLDLVLNDHQSITTSINRTCDTLQGYSETATSNDKESAGFLSHILPGN